MRIFLLIILLFNLVVADETNITSDENTSLNSDNNITITLPEEMDEENVTNTDVANYNTSKLNIAILINENKFFKYLPSLINSIDAYLLNKDINFNLKVFDMDNNLTSLNKITQKYNNIFIYSTDPIIVNKLLIYPDNNFFLPILNKNQLDYNFSSEDIQNIYFGGLDFYKQIKKLNNFVIDKNYIIKENSILSNLITNIEKNITKPKYILTYPINYKRELKDLNNSYIFANTKVVHTAQILSNFTYYRIKPKLILSTQINYNPLLFSLTNPEDTKKLIVANSLSLPDLKLLDINMNLGSDLKFNWLNYTTSVLLNKLYINELGEYPYFLNDFNLYIFNNQINYKTKLYRLLDNGFIEIN
jgi:hypothetical protein